MLSFLHRSRANQSDDPTAKTEPRDRIRARPERSLDADMIRFVFLVGLPLIFALSVAGGILTVMFSNT